MVIDNDCATDHISSEALRAIAAYLKGPEVVQLASSTLALDLVLGNERREAINKWLSDFEYRWQEETLIDWLYESGNAFLYVFFCVPKTNPPLRKVNTLGGEKSERSESCNKAGKG